MLLKLLVVYRFYLKESYLKVYLQEITLAG